jgi:uncharacterized protein YfaS (alpha-2-macroglobulin family)
MGTLYTATIRENIKNLKGQTVAAGTSYTFQTDPLSLVSLRTSALNRDMITLRLEFNMPVDPSRLRGFLKVTSDQNGQSPLSLGVNAGRPETVLPVTVRVGDLTGPRRIFLRLAAGLTGEKGTLGLTEDVVRPVDVQPVLTVNELSAERDGIRVYSNFDVSLDAAKDFIKIEPETSFSLDYYYGGCFFIRGDFRPRERFVLTFKKGLPSERNGIVLEEDFSRAVIIPDREPSINLPAPGMFLSPLDGGRVPLELVNVKKLNVSLWRLYENNIPYAMRALSSGYDDSYAFPRDLAKRVFNREFDLSLPLNETVRRALSLDDMAGGQRGLFLLSLNNPDDEYWYERNQIINLSDMGAVVRLWEDGLLVWANTLSGLQPLADASVRLYSTANQLLGEGTTDAQGLWVLKRDSVWSDDPGLMPSLVTVSKNDDVTFVRLTKGLLSQNIFDTAGRPWLREGYDALLFSGRDLYRPGETAPFEAILRTPQFLPPEPFPVLFSVNDPLGRTVTRRTELLSSEGSAIFNMNIPENAMTGRWSVVLSIPGSEGRPLTKMGFSVEDFAPPRIEVELDSDAERLAPGDETAFDLSARYLFGADGAGLKWEASWSARELPFVPQNPKWRAYRFGDPERHFAGEKNTIEEGTLDETGAARFTFSPPGEWEAPALINVTVTGRVMEESGRWVSKAASLSFWPSPFLLGLRAPGEAPAVRSDLTFSIAAVTPDEKPADPGELTAELCRVTWNYNLVRVDGYTRWQSSEVLSKVDEKTVSLKDGLGQATFRPMLWGTYLVRVADAGNNVRASFRFYAEDPEYAEKGGSQLVDRVEIEPDREKYRTGETAKVVVRAPFEGMLLFNVEAESLIDRKIIKIEKGETIVEVPITENMIPNAWCAAWLIRPLGREEAGMVHRAAGVARLMVDTTRHRLDVALDAPEKTTPSTPLSVTVALRDSDGKPAKGEVTLALVDDGVLGLTDFKTPDPEAHFLGARRLNSEGFDIYDLLMPVEARETDLLHPAGGMAESMAAFAGGKKAQRFKILSFFEGALSADENGLVRATLDLPEFSGRARLFAVALSGSRFGKAQQNLQISREIVTEADLPRFASPGDVFTAPLTVYNTGTESRDVELRVSTSGLTPAETLMKGVVPAGGSRKWSLTLTAGDPGTAVCTVATQWTEGSSVQSFDQSIELPIRSPFPVVTLSGSGFFAAGDSTLDIPKNALTGDIQGKLTLADTPLVDLTKAVSFLSRYPYGCLEQTLSSAWPFLILPDALAEIDPQLVNNADVKAKTDAALTRIQAMQLFDGSFSMWPGEARTWEWGSVYAAHFLVEARKAGLDYPQGMLTAALNWLKQYLASLPSGRYNYQEYDDFTTKAYAVFVLALNGEKPLGWIHYLTENRVRMWPSGHIWLAGARALMEGRADALRELGAPGGTDSLPPEALRYTLESGVRNAAQLLSLWTELEPRAPEAVRLVQTLLEQGRQNRWYNTQENATVAMALGRFLTKAGYAKGSLEGALKDDSGQILASFRSGEKVSLNVENLPDSPLHLSFTGKGEGYYAWSLTGTPLTTPKPESRGISAACVWSNRSGAPIDPSLPLAQGTEVQVSLTLNPSMALGNVVVSCLLPAGMEIDNPRLTSGNGEEQDKWDVHYDVRDDRLLLFITSLLRETTYRFTLRAVTRGTFAFPPLAAEGMYDPGVHFIGGAGKNLVIR